MIFKNKGNLKIEGYSVTNKGIAISVLVYVIFWISTYMYYFTKKHQLRKTALNGIFIILIFDLMIGTISGQNNNDKYFKRIQIKQHDEFMEYFVTKIKSPETERIVFMPDEFGSNMSLKYGYSNIGFFSSARNRDVLKQMYRWGFNVQMEEQLWMTSYSGTFLNYSMCGVKYYISKDKIENNEIYGFELINQFKDYYIYRNKNNFNFGYYLAKNVEESYNPFKMQNDFLNGLKNNEIQNENYFENIEDSSVLECEKITEYNEETGKYNLTYKVKALKDCNIYLFSDYDLQVYIDDNLLFKNYSNIWSYETGIKQIKYLKEGENLEFAIETSQNLELLFLYVSNNEKIQSRIEEMNQTNYMENIKIMSEGFSGKVYFENEGYLVFPVAYDKHWKIYVDNKETKTTCIGGVFLGVLLGTGKKSIICKWEF